MNNGEFYRRSATRLAVQLRPARSNPKTQLNRTGSVLYGAKLKAAKPRSSAELDRRFAIDLAVYANIQCMLSESCVLL